MKSEQLREPIKVLFCSPPLIGHCNPMIKFIELLSLDEGFEVTFATSQSDQEKIKI